MSTGVALLVAFVLLIANAFFVAVEFGLIATQRAQLEDKANDGNKRAKTALAAITDLNTQIAGAQLGITMASIALGLVAEPSVAKLLEHTVLSGLSDGPRHTVEALDERASAKTPDELAMLLAEAHHGQVLDGYDFTLLSNTLELGGATIEHAVVPMDKVATALATAPVAAIEQSMAKSGHSRLALVGEAGEPMGWVHAKDLLAMDHQVWSEPLPPHRKRRLIPLDYQTPVEDALEELQANRQHFALATKDGKALGIITLEDVLEVLVSGLAGSQDLP
ncbi:hypothetical protein GQR58_028504 [Nymphon striatum]|nr:hypothetical protein GQR58_028504 [Nymphon striatum]